MFEIKVELTKSQRVHDIFKL